MRESKSEIPIWQKNLRVLWFGNFATGVGLSLILPFLALYVDTLGAFTKVELNFWSGAVFSISFLTTALVSPLWGRLADRFGRKPMLLRSAAGMAIVLALIGFAQNIWQLLALRALYGLFSGYISNSIALVASTTPKEQSGQVLGTLNTAGISGMLVGPLFGGAIVTFLGYRQVFWLTAAILCGVFVLSLLFVREEFTAPEKGRVTPMREVWATVDKPRMIASMLVATLLLQVAATSINPILSLYVRELMNYQGPVEMLSGVVAAAPGVVSIIAAPRLGALGDRIGTEKVLTFGLALSIVVFIPMALVTDVWQLVILRLILGLATAALMPGVQALLMRHSPVSATSRIFGYNQSMQSIGAVLGPLIGAAVAGLTDYRFVFIATMVFAIINLINVRVSAR
jgi:DHA1 family multidrug resistance protein-like MFS transporter